MNKKKTIDEMNLFSDIFFNQVMSNNALAINHILSTILDQNVKISSLSIQRVIPGVEPRFRSIQLDCLATDEKGNLYNLEVQNVTKKASMDRINFHSYMVGTRALLSGEKEFEKIRDIFILFFYEQDPENYGKPIYHAQKFITEINRNCGEKEHILLINGQYQGNDPLGNLIRDFRCTNPDDIQNEILKESVRYYKETKEGNEIMCRLVDAYAQEQNKDLLAKNRELTLAIQANEERLQTQEKRLQTQEKRLQTQEERLQVKEKEIRVKEKEIQAINSEKDESILKSIRQYLEFHVSKDQIIQSIIIIFNLTSNQAEEYYSSVVL